MATAGAVHRPTRKEVVFYYKTNRSQFHVPEQIHVFHIVKNLDGTVDRQTAAAAMESAAAELKNGVSFPEVADRYSDCAGNGGDLGWVERDVMVEEFEEEVFALPLNEVSPVFETRFGLHIAVVTEKRGPGILPIGAVYDQIFEHLLQRRIARTGTHE